MIKRGIRNDVLMTEARDRLWELAPLALDFHIPSSWMGPINRGVALGGHYTIRVENNFQVVDFLAAMELRCQLEVRA